MLPVLWHHPSVCFGITHLDETGWANLTQSLALPIAISRKSMRRHRRYDRTC
jgi:hypothetical protein